VTVAPQFGKGDALSKPAAAKRSITSPASTASPMTCLTAASMSRDLLPPGVIRQPFANHRRDPLEERQMRRDLLRLLARHFATESFADKCRFARSRWDVASMTTV